MKYKKKIVITKSLFSIGFIGFVLLILGSSSVTALPFYFGIVGIVIMCFSFLGGIASMIFLVNKKVV